MRNRRDDRTDGIRKLNNETINSDRRRVSGVAREHRPSRVIGVALADRVTGGYHFTAAVSPSRVGVITIAALFACVSLVSVVQCYVVRSFHLCRASRVRPSVNVDNGGAAYPPQDIYNTGVYRTALIGCRDTCRADENRSLLYIYPTSCYPRDLVFGSGNPLLSIM